MTTINATYILIAKPYVAAGMRARAIAQGRDITNAQSTAEQTAAIIEREVGRLLQLALAAAQIPGVTPASGSVYDLGAAVAAPSADTVADAVRAELGPELARVDESWARLGLDASRPVSQSSVEIRFGDVVLDLAGTETVTVARQ